MDSKRIIPNIVRSKIAFKPNPWIASPTRAPRGLLGASEDVFNAVMTWQSWVERADSRHNLLTDLPRNFYNEKLHKLAQGSEKDVLEITSEYGLLVWPSPRMDFIRKSYRKSTEAVCGHKRGRHFIESILKEFELAQESGMYRTVTDADDSAKYDTVFSCSSGMMSQVISSCLFDADSLNETWQPMGDVASISEIRETANRLLRSFEILKQCDGSRAISDIMIPPSIYGEDTKFSVDTFDFSRQVEYAVKNFKICLANVSPTFVIEYLDADNPSEKITEEMAPVLIPQNLGTLTEAVAVQMFNDICDPAPWRECAQCNRELKYKAASRKDSGTSRSSAKFCNDECLNKHTVAAYRKRKRDAEKLYEQGFSAAQIYERVKTEKTSIETVEKWIVEFSKKKDPS